MRCEDTVSSGQQDVAVSQWVHSTQTARRVVVQDRGSRQTSIPRKVPQQGVLSAATGGVATRRPSATARARNQDRGLICALAPLRHCKRTSFQRHFQQNIRFRSLNHLQNTPF